MYEIRNLKLTPTSVNLKGRCFILPKGGTETIRDRQAKEDTIQVLKTSRHIKLTKLEGEEPPEDTSSPEYQAYQKIERKHQAVDRAKRRARGELV